MRLHHLAVHSLLSLALAACATEVDGDDPNPYDPADEEEPPLVELPALVLTSPIPQRAGAWWGDVKTPQQNQVWGEILNSTPGKNLTAPFTYQWKCSLPRFDGSPQTLQLRRTSFSVNSTIQKEWSYPTPDTVYSYTLDPAKYSSGWVEIRIRCHGRETSGSETGNDTAITAGFPVQIRGGTSTSQNHSGTDYLDTHGWYSRGVDYVYATFLNLSQLVGVSQSGIIALKLKARVSGDTYLDHFMVKIDGVIATMSDGKPAEFFGSTGDRTIYIDTHRLTNGVHVFAMHAHGIEKSDSEQPGKQLAAQSEIRVTVQN